jgi:hypothetical protein
MRLTDPERELAAQIDFDIDVCRLIKDVVRKPLEQALRSEPGVGETPGNGLSVRTRIESIAGFVDRYQAALTPRGYSTFWSTRSEGRRPRDEMVVLKTADDREIVRWRGTAGAAHGPSTADILAKLDSWSTLCSLKVTGASTDWLALAFDTLPGNLCAFAEDVSLFCAYSIDQVLGQGLESDDPAAFAAARKLCPDTTLDMGVKLLAHYLTETHSLFLWWE